MEKFENYKVKFLYFTKGEFVQYRIRLYKSENNRNGYEYFERYSTLKGLHGNMKKEAKSLDPLHFRNIINFPKFPSKKYFGSFDEEFLKQRMANLELYFNTLLGSQQFYNLSSLTNWIESFNSKVEI